MPPVSTTGRPEPPARTPPAREFPTGAPRRRTTSRPRRGHGATAPNRLGARPWSTTSRRSAGHYGRIGDLDAVAALGFRELRYPVLWEHVAPDRPGECDWRWHDERLGRVRDLGMAPIAGLVHH